MVSKNGRKIYNPATAERWVPPKKWVTLEDGSEVCVWALSVAETLSMSDFCQRHPDDPRQGLDNREAAIWQLMYCCRAGEEPDSPRIFDDHMANAILSLSPDDFGDLMRAVDEVGGIRKRSARDREDFTSAPKEASSLT